MFVRQSGVLSLSLSLSLSHIHTHTHTHTFISYASHFSAPRAECSSSFSSFSGKFYRMELGGGGQSDRKCFNQSFLFCFVLSEVEGESNASNSCCSTFLLGCPDGRLALKHNGPELHSCADGAGSSAVPASFRRLRFCSF